MLDGILKLKVKYYKSKILLKYIYALLISVECQNFLAIYLENH